MRYEDLLHAIRAATVIIQQREVIIIGSQAILGTWHEDDLPDVATMSPEVDVTPMRDDDAETLATHLDAIIGEGSAFHETHGFYVQGVGRRTAVLPPGWETRLIRAEGLSTEGRVGLCLDAHDLCAAKMIAGRGKDHTFVSALLGAGLIDADILEERLASIPDGELVGANDYIEDGQLRRIRALAWLRAQC